MITVAVFFANTGPQSYAWELCYVWLVDLELNWPGTLLSEPFLLFVLMIVSFEHFIACTQCDLRHRRTPISQNSSDETQHVMQIYFIVIADAHTAACANLFGFSV